MNEVDVNKLREEQLKLCQKVVLSDSLDKPKTIGGVDNCYVGTDKIISAITILDYKTLEIIEKKYSAGQPRINYIPGYLSYRELPVIAEAYSLVENKPDVMMLEANGTLHPRRFGMASHFGVLFNVPTIGVSKKLLCGKIIGESVYLEKDVVGKRLITKKEAKPIFVSPGNLISLQTAYEIAKEMIKEPYKLPYPLAMAHKYSHQLRRKLLETNAESQTN